jgi:hypothetical protein
MYIKNAQSKQSPKGGHSPNMVALIVINLAWKPLIDQDFNTASDVN